MPSQASKETAPSQATIVRRPRGRPKLEDVAEIEGQLVSAALDEFVHNGYAGASIRSIAKAAGLSRSTLLSRFPTKEQLFEAIMRQQIEQMSAATTLRPARNRRELERGLKAYANRALEFSLEGTLLNVNRLICSESHRFPELGEAAVRNTQLGVGHVSEFIRQCASVSDVECRDPEGLAEAFLLMIRGWYLNVMMTNRRVSVAEREAWVERAVGSLDLGEKPSR